MIVAVTLGCSVVGLLWTTSEVLAQGSAWTNPEWLMSKEQIDKFRREEYFQVKNHQKATNPGNTQIQALNRMVHYWMSQMLTANRARIPKEVVDRFLANELLNTQTGSLKARELMMEETINCARSLLQHPEPIIRTNTALLLNQLSSEPTRFESGREIPAVPYIPSYRFLMEVLQDDKQLPEVRILAARGLTRILRDSPALDGVTRSSIAVAYVDALGQLPISQDDENWWLRYRIVEGLGYVERLTNVTDAPIVIDTLFQVLSNPQETWLIRSQAALSLSRLPFSGTTNVELVTHEIASLLAEMADAYAKQPDDPVWRHAFSRVYFAFRPPNNAQASRNWGLMFQTNRPGVGVHGPYIQQACEKVFPVALPLVPPVPLGQPTPELSESAVTALKDWLGNNAPADRRPTPKSDPLAIIAADGGPAKDE